MCALRFHSRVPANRQGTTLSAYLAGRFTYLSEEQWQQQVAQGRILIDGGSARADQPLCGNQLVTYLPAPFEEPDAPLRFSVLYEDAWMLAVDKPPGLLVHRAGNAFTHNLVHLVRCGSGVSPAPGAVALNRLDRETSGVVLLLKEATQAARWTEALRDDGARKRYRAVVHGRVEPDITFIDAPIGKEDAAGRQSYRHAVRPDGKAARTVVEHIEHIGAAYSLLRLRLCTGRTHQARLHCAHLGCPIVGDRLYGGYADRGEEGGAVLMGRQALHCECLQLRHPCTGSVLRVEAEVPPDMRQLIQRIMRSTSTQVRP